MWEVLPATALKLVGPKPCKPDEIDLNHKLKCVDDSRPNFHLRTFKRDIHYRTKCLTVWRQKTST